jgi:hypothetical protein
MDKRTGPGRGPETKVISRIIGVGVAVGLVALLAALRISASDDTIPHNSALPSTTQPFTAESLAPPLPPSTEATTTTLTPDQRIRRDPAYEAKLHDTIRTPLINVLAELFNNKAYDKVIRKSEVSAETGFRKYRVLVPQDTNNTVAEIYATAKGDETSFDPSTITEVVGEFYVANGAPKTPDNPEGKGQLQSVHVSPSVVDGQERIDVVGTFGGGGFTTKADLDQNTRLAITDPNDAYNIAHTISGVVVELAGSTH